MAAGQAAFRRRESPVQIDKRRDIFELAVGYGLILLVIWTPGPWQRPLYLAAAAFILFASWRSFDSWPAMGLRVANLLRSLWIVGAAMLFSAIGIAVAARLHTLRPWQGPVELIQRFWGYAIWAFLQQFLLQIFFLQRFLRLVSSKNLAIALAVAVFTLAHLPNPLLTIATLLWGLAACLLFLRYRNLIPLGIAHAILGITIALCFPGSVTHNMRVGLGYLTYTPHMHHRSHARMQLVLLSAIIENPERKYTRCNVEPPFSTGFFLQKKPAAQISSAKTLTPCGLSISLSAMMRP